ncbi:GNAT family N-acetyltransferase [Caenimonas terrae]|uniref:GNAT family N-acetyltransferase n=1 Tax=Caenimonas terrae TaxID=696074 RepID=A0ABW0NA51_9BURK
MDSTDIETIERATVQAVSPQAQTEIAGWVLPFDDGTVGRARSAVPLSHAPPAVAVLPQIEAAYAQRNLPVDLRVPVLAAFEPFRSALAARGYREHTLTEVHTADVASVRAVSDGDPAELLATPGPDWASIFLGPGFDPVDGASRVSKLGQAAGSLFALVREDGRPAAAGAAAFSHGWASVHGMRTAQDRRGRGLAGRVLATLAGAATDRGYRKVFLQVAAENAAARSLYRRAGFAPAWRYSYWRLGQ